MAAAGISENTAYKVSVKEAGHGSSCFDATVARTLVRPGALLDGPRAVDTAAFSTTKVSSAADPKGARAAGGARTRARARAVHVCA